MREVKDGILLIIMLITTIGLLMLFNSFFTTIASSINIQHQIQQLTNPVVIILGIAILTIILYMIGTILSAKSDRRRIYYH